MPPDAVTTAVAPMITWSPTTKIEPPAPPPPESLLLAQPRLPSALRVPLMVSVPVWLALTAASTIRPPPLPPVVGLTPKPSPSRQPLSPPDAPNSISQSECL